MPNQNDLEGEFVIGEENAPAATPAANTPKNKVHFFTNLVLYPGNVVFENQEENEEIVLLVRRDLITNLPWVLFAIFLILIPPLISIFSSLFSPFFVLSPNVQLVAVLFYYLIVIGFIITQFVLWYFNIGLVTTKRIIDFDVSGILFKEVSETKLNLVEDVTYSQVGAIRSVFNYGDVKIQTAGNNENFEFDRAPEPARIVRIIADMIGGPR